MRSTRSWGGSTSSSESLTELLDRPGGPHRAVLFSVGTGQRIFQSMTATRMVRTVVSTPK